MNMTKGKGSSSRELPGAQCDALCCKYMAIEGDTPRCKRDYDDLRWYLLHRGVSVLLDRDQAWYVAFDSRCEALGADDRCERYRHRPVLCREHGTDGEPCEFYRSFHDVKFEQPEELEEWLDARGVDWRWKRG